MKTKQLLLVILLIMSNIVLAEELFDNGVSLTRKENDYIIEFELIDYKTIKTNVRKSNTETEDFIHIDVPEYGITYEEGTPQLPQLSFSLAIPYDMEKPDIEISAVAENNIKLDHKIYPTQYYFPDTLNRERRFVINDSVYSGRKKIDLPFATVSEPFIVSGVKGVMVTIFPFQYDPVKNDLTVRKKGTVKIKIGKEVDTKVVETESMTDYLNDFFVNYGDCYNSLSNSGSLRSSSQYPKGNYLLIYPLGYDYNSHIYRFIEHKEALGYNVLTHVYNGYTCTYSGDCFTLTSPSQIKNAIQAKYDNPNTRPEYVLLVGDYADVGGWERVLNSGESIKTDLPYSLLEGNDHYADVGFGRWSVTSVTELNNIISKTIEMENKFRASTINPKRATLVADYDSWILSFLGISFYDDIIKVQTKLNNDGYSSTIVSEHHGGTTQHIINSLSNGPYLACYSGHGASNTRAWIGPYFHTSDVESLTNSIYPVIFSFACHTGNFAHQGNTAKEIRDKSKNPCLGEKFIRVERGACAFWGATRTVDYMADHALIKYVFTDRFHQHGNVSKITNMGIKDLLNNFSFFDITWTNRLVSEAAYNLLGDPSLQIRFNECPTNLKFCGGETDNGETLQYPIASTISVGGSGYQNIPYNYTVRTGGNLALRANNSITLKPGFVAQAGSSFSASITSTACSPPALRSLNQTEYELEDDVVLPDNSNEIISFKTVDVRIYPNPFNEFITISFYCYKQTTISLKLFDIHGKVISFVTDNVTYPEGKNEINIKSNSLEEGIYLLQLTLNNEDFVYKLIKN